MEQGKNIFDKILNKVPGGYFGIISVVIRIFCDMTALLLFPKYNFFENMISELGVGKGGIFFNLGLILSGIICVPFYIELGRSLKSDYIKEKSVKTGLMFFYISDIAYMLVGVFPSIKENYIIFYIHGTLALISWLTGVVYLSIFGRLMMKNDKYANFTAYLTFILAVCVLIAASTWMPITEWLMTITFIIWVFTISSYMINKKL
jgi:hypothetical membrane protein